MAREHEDHIKRLTEKILSRQQGSIIIGDQPSVTHSSVTRENNELFEFLRDKGYLVHKVGNPIETHYLIVSSVSPIDNTAEVDTEKGVDAEELRQQILSGKIFIA